MAHGRNRRSLRSRADTSTSSRISPPTARSCSSPRTTEQLPEQVNSGQLRFNAFVAPDESFLIVPMYGREDSLGSVDYYVVFRSADDTWSEPINLGPTVNSATGNEWSASLSPDGKVLFFMASRSEIVDHRAPEPMSYAAMRELHDSPMNGNSDIWWIDAGVIDSVRP